jgi:hypothetical protein
MHVQPGKSMVPHSRRRQQHYWRCCAAFRSHFHFVRRVFVRSLIPTQLAALPSIESRAPASITPPVFRDASGLFIILSSFVFSFDVIRTNKSPSLFASVQCDLYVKPLANLTGMH